MTKHLFPASAALALGIASFLAPISEAADLTPLGEFENHEDVGSPTKAGFAFFDEATQTYNLTAAGTNMWGAEDQFHFAWKKIEGDFIAHATIQFVGSGVDPHRKIGIIARNSLDAGSKYADACVHGDTLSSLQYRSEKDGETDQVVLSVFHPTEIQLERKGNVFTFSAAVFGEDYKSVSHEIDLNEEAYVGLFVCSHNEDILETAIFSNVRIVIPAPSDFQPYRDYYGSHIEVMEVGTGLRKVLHSENRSLQAPNWTPDNKRLIYNADGLLYNYWLDDGHVEVLPTGPQDQNNNDHAISWGGDQIAISNHDGEDRLSTIYIMPIDGSENPTRVSDPANGHSFLHGWTRDDEGIIFTGLRDGQWDIWSIDIESGAETQITNLSTLDDGAEASPDGEWIYFNSARTGTMQIWKSRVDGNDQEQFTFDAYNNWFPHVSPDGKWIIYLAYPTTIDPNDHPFYKQVTLKLMPTSGGPTKTIAYLYGGQGTINVPSWSPDSRRIAFVSNTQM